MNNGLVKGRNTIFIDGCAVQWFSQLLRTKVLIYGEIPYGKFICMCELTLPYIANENEIKAIAKLKIEEIESL